MSKQGPLTTPKNKPKTSKSLMAAAVKVAQRDGKKIETAKKMFAGSNRQGTLGQGVAAKLEDDQEITHVPKEVSVAIREGRVAKGLTQKELATRISEKAQVIMDYEAGRGSRNHVILGKIERVIGVKLRGKTKDVGNPLGAVPKNMKK